MKKLLLLTAVVCLMAPAAWALTGIYGWEDCGTVLGTYPNDGTGITCTSVTDRAHTGTHSLYVVRTHATITTQAYVAWIKGLVTGDVVTGIFWAYDTTAGTGAYPSVRIWAHYCDSVNPNSYVSSASGSADYSGVPLGWGTVPNAAAYSWTFNNATATALMIEVRSYGYTAPLNGVWIDDIEVTAPTRGGVEIVFPAPGPSAVEPSTWGSIKALYQ